MLSKSAVDLIFSIHLFLISVTVFRQDLFNVPRIDRIMEAQTDRATRLRNADDIICNDGDIAQLHAAVDKLHRKYLDQVE